MPEQPEMTKEAFLNQAAALGLEGDAERMQELYEETKRTLARAAGVFGVDTTGFAPSPINPQFEVRS
jgi:hypothetical protein